MSSALRHCPSCWHPPPWATGCWPNGRRPSSASTRPTSTSGSKPGCAPAGIKTIHFVCPSIWAWRGERAKKLKAAADHVLCLFPFEPALLQQHGVAATFVGHPLADAIPLEPPRGAARAALGLADGDTVVALLPGSRRSEIPTSPHAWLQAAAQMQRQRSGLRFVLPVAPGLRGLVEPIVAQHGAGRRIQLLDGQSHAGIGRL
jgi:lipid-A-disaccharide synthase